MSSVVVNNSDISILRNQQDVDTFRLNHPNGFTILDSLDSSRGGIGLIGQSADTARNIGGNPNDWISFAQKIGPAIHESNK